MNPEAIKELTRSIADAVKPDPFAAIPENYYWMAAKGRLKPSEPLYAVQIIDAESGIAVTAAEAETLEEAIAIALRALAQASMVGIEAAGVDVVQIWHNLPQSKRREVAAQFGVPPQGCQNFHLWTMKIIDAAKDRQQIDELKAAIAYAHLHS